MVKSDYVVVHSDPNSATILENQVKRASLQKIGNGVFSLREVKDGEENKEKKNNIQSWVLNVRVDGEMRPFSMSCYRAARNEPVQVQQGLPQVGDLALKIKDHIFFHNNGVYSIGEAIPEGASTRDSFSGSKYICRLVNFPFMQLEHVDEETKHQMKRHRGVAVGEIGGLGADGYHLKLYADELADIGLLLAGSTYLIYTTR